VDITTATSHMVPVQTSEMGQLTCARAATEPLDATAKTVCKSYFKSDV
jgi:hypothetical protein